ncbi:RDD family protein [Streptomyces sp. 3MP-14]|uniref:RDD family protein n=1 Tax=Streptomyces mimosae TaxID=2586635 RepID=A0A5N5ZUB2_9ACTN|nr:MULTISPECIES: RDD family protein [Streptomyces]KAB8160114.1 RDD family protein [Streptomyces mimosae]KAB8176717.1 RDD family protein [Streptomyces sp. 3MP-14]
MNGQLVTGDAVVLGLQPARLPSRALAVAIDLTVVVGLYLLLSVVVLSTVLPLGTAAAMAVQVALLLLVVVGGPVLVETLSHGRSLGKVLCGLRVVREDGGPIRFRHALVRGAIGFVELLMTAGSVACVASLVSARGRRLGDVFAGTLVVRERVAGGARRRRGAVPVAPPELAGRFAEVDLSQVPDELWLTVRRFLGREGQLDPVVARSLAVRLADDVLARVGEPPPDGVSPVDFLTALLGERQRREAARVMPGAVDAAAGVPAAGGFQPIVGGAAEAPTAGGGGAAAVSPPAIPERPEAGGEPVAEPGRRTGFAPPF